MPEPKTKGVLENDSNALCSTTIQNELCTCVPVLIHLHALGVQKHWTLAAILLRWRARQKRRVGVDSCVPQEEHTY